MLHPSGAGRPARRGAILVGAVIFLLLVVGFAGLALDTAFVRSTTQELQRAADAAALAATEILDSGSAGNQFSPVRQAAVDCALANDADGEGVQCRHNFSNDPDGDIVVGRWNPTTRTFTPTEVGCDAVKVKACRSEDSLGGTVDLLFGPLFGTSASALERTAIATRGNLNGPAVVIVFDPAMPKAFDMRGNSEMDASAGAIQVNSTQQVQAFYLNGAPDYVRCRAKAINVVGGAQYSTGSVVPPPKEDQPPLPDPLADLPYPDPLAMTDYGGITQAGDYPPGYYPKGIDCNDGDIVLHPGVYVFGAQGKAGGIDIHGDAMVRATGGTMIYLEKGAVFKISGNAPGIHIVAPPSGVYEGVALFAHRESAALFDISGSGHFEVRGVIYLYGGHFEMDGVVDRWIGKIFVNSLQFRGTGTYYITGEGPPDDTPLYTYLVK